MMTMKSALITGAASGIGKACAERMAQEGYGVVVADVNLPAAEELAAKLAAEGLSAIAVHMDVADEQEVEAGFDKMMETYGSCDLVMSNAGVQIVHPFEEYPFADWRKMMAIHADGAFLVSRAAYRRMKASGKGGRIVFTGSVQSFVGSKADPRAGGFPGHYGGGSGEEHHAAGYRGRGVHHGGGCSQHAGIPVQGSGRSDGPVPAADPRLGHDVIES